MLRLRDSVPTVLLFAVACAEPPAAPDVPSFAQAVAGPTVTATAPNESIRDTTLDVRVLGSGFDAGSRADFLLAGAADAKVRTNSTRFVSSGEVVANITIDADAVPAYRDVAVTTTTGKKGVGSEAFVVLEPVIVPLPGSLDSHGHDVNSSGLVVGHYSVAGTTCTQRAFAWSAAAGASTLPLPAGYCQAQAYKVNEAGTVVGAIWPDGGAWGTTGVVARWTVAGMNWTVEALPKPASGFSWLANGGLDEAGNTTAYWNNASGIANSWVWQDAIGWTELAPRAGMTGSNALGMNGRGEFVGACTGACYWSSPLALPILLPVPSGASNIRAYAINSLGVAVGGFTTPVRSKATNHVARWRPNGSGGWLLEDLGTIGIAKDVNDDGTIVGIGFAWLPASGFSVLDPLSKTQTSFVEAVSNRGPGGVAWIVGYGKSSAGSQQRTLIWKR